MDNGINGQILKQISVTDSPHVNCDTSYQCATINAIPATESLLKKSRLPFALVLAPYRSLKEGDVREREREKTKYTPKFIY